MALIKQFLPSFLPEEEITNESSQTSYSGKAAELSVRSWLTFNGRTCSVPEVDRNGVDLLVDGTKKAQIKKIVWAKKNKTCNMNWQNPSGKSRYSCEQLDLFYQVMLTNLRLVIFEVPTIQIPTNSKGEFVVCTGITLCTEFFQRRKIQLDIRNYCVHEMYHPSLLLNGGGVAK